MRPAPGKTVARVFDYVDVHVDTLTKAAMARHQDTPDFLSHHSVLPGRARQGHNQIGKVSIQRQGAERINLSNSYPGSVESGFHQGVGVHHVKLDVVAAQAGAVLVSHSACSALVDHPRNLNDLQILALSRFGGVMGLIFNPAFISKGQTASLEDIVSHMLHFKSLGALNALALGTDFNGIEPPPKGMAHVGQLPRLVDALVEAGVRMAESRRKGGAQPCDSSAESA